MKKIAFILFFVLPFQTLADVTCHGVPTAVYAGVHGPAPSGSTFWVDIPNTGALPLGLATSEMAKARFSLAQTAFVAKKKFILKYYSHTSCKQAAADKATPTFAAISE